MGSWTRVSFDPGEQSTSDIESELQSALDEPELFEQDGVVVWKAYEDVDAQRLTDLSVTAPKALVMNVHDATSSGTGWLYVRDDGRYVLRDATEGGEGYRGRDVIAYFYREHDIVGVRR